MSYLTYGRPEPETLDSIEISGDCGCHQRPRGAFFLCNYHEGYDDAIDAMKQRFKVPS